jgi:hypothetical protein
MNYFNREKINYCPLSNRVNKVDIKKMSVSPYDYRVIASKEMLRRIKNISMEIQQARINKRPVILAFGAHAVKNGLGLILSSLIEEGYVTHLATNGAGVIHDWEFSYQGFSSEDVRANVKVGKFGIWEETGLYLNLALVAGAFEGLGYGESVGSFINSNGVTIPSVSELEAMIYSPQTEGVPIWKKAAAADYLDLILSEGLRSGKLEIKHPFSEYSVQSRSFIQKVPFTSHPMFGHDIIYTHRACRGAAIGRCADRDFLSFAESVSDLEGGVYLSVGSAVMSPMIFEKSLSMARNVSRQKDEDITNFTIHVVDLQNETWDWSQGEPPSDNPAYYLRFMKTFNRMGCPVEYLSMDNRDFLVLLYKELKS